MINDHNQLEHPYISHIYLARDVLSVGLPAANCSFFAVISENNISHTSHSNMSRHIYIYIYMNIFENLGENQNDISIRLFHDEYHREIEYIYIYIYVSFPPGIFQWQAL